MAGELRLGQFRYSITPDDDLVIGSPLNAGLNTTKYITFQVSNTTGFGANPNLHCSFDGSSWNLNFSKDGTSVSSFVYMSDLQELVENTILSDYSGPITGQVVNNTDTVLTAIEKLEGQLSGVSSSSLTLAEVDAEINTKLNAYSDPTKASTSSVTDLLTKYNTLNGDGSVVGSVVSEINLALSTYSDPTKATTQSVTNLSSDLNGQISTINQTLSTTSDAITGIKSHWGITTSANGVVTGSVALDGSGASSTFTVQVDKFQIKTPNSTMTPFSVVGDVVHMDNVVISSGLTVDSIISSNFVAGTYVDSPTGYKLFSTPFTAHFLDGSDHNVQFELGGDSSIDGHLLSGLSLDRLEGGGVVEFVNQSTNWVCPPGIHQVTVTLVGAGGGSVLTLDGNFNLGGSSGGCVTFTAPVTPGVSYPIVAGGPGAGNNSNSVSFSGDMSRQADYYPDGFYVDQDYASTTYGETLPVNPNNHHLAYIVSGGISAQMGGNSTAFGFVATGGSVPSLPHQYTYVPAGNSVEPGYTDQYYYAGMNLTPPTVSYSDLLTFTAGLPSGNVLKEGVILVQGATPSLSGANIYYPWIGAGVSTTITIPYVVHIPYYQVNANGINGSTINAATFANGGGYGVMLNQPISASSIPGAVSEGVSGIVFKVAVAGTTGGFVGGSWIENQASISAGSFVIGSYYQITSLGTTTWASCGTGFCTLAYSQILPSAAIVGAYFKATAAGSGTGTCKAAVVTTGSIGWKLIGTNNGVDTLPPVPASGGTWVTGNIYSESDYKNACIYGGYYTNYNLHESYSNANFTNVTGITNYTVPGGADGTYSIIPNIFIKSSGTTPGFSSYDIGAPSAIGSGVNLTTDTPGYGAGGGFGKAGGSGYVLIQF